MTDRMTPEQRSRCMAAVKGRDTRPEMAVRRYLHSRGLRYRVNVRSLPGSPDIVLRRFRTVVFIDGCFWHGHQGCRFFKLPATRADYWRQKIAMNIARDYAATVDLRLLGWRVIRIWECELHTKALRKATLPRIYDAITHPPAAGGEKTPAARYTCPNDTYAGTTDVPAILVAEPIVPYGPKR
ncbi:MAG: very short patch repair endonuclease [Pseudoflavonifractor sp.]|nr:very short patch repair endonuclease [Alloprevotella sp.]MCM1116108.1 very short patch repair endonuclease [Pseudoflavonifractor sp.]